MFTTAHGVLKRFEDVVQLLVNKYLYGVSSFTLFLQLIKYRCSIKRSDRSHTRILYVQKEFQCIHSVRKFWEFLFLATNVMVRRRYKIQGG